MPLHDDCGYKYVNLPEVNHKDGKKWRNYVDNLEWVIHLGNVEHSVAIGLSVRNKL